jgi:hypothetical protein
MSAGTPTASPSPTSRYYGLLGHRHRVAHLAPCRHLLGTATRPDAVGQVPIVVDYRDRYEALTGRSWRVCPERGIWLEDAPLPIDLCRSVQCPRPLTRL